MKKVFREKDDRAKALLVTFVGIFIWNTSGTSRQQMSCGSPCQIRSLKKKSVSQIYIRRSLALLRMDGLGTALSDHFLQFGEILRQLTELDQVSQMFISLPASYDVVTTTKKNLPNDQIKLNKVKARLMAEDSIFQVNVLVAVHLDTNL